MAKTTVLGIGILSIAVFVPACNQPEKQKARPTATFKVMEVRVEREGDEHGTTYNGRAILVAISEGLKKGKYLVYLTVWEANALPGEENKTVVLLVDGVGDVRFSEHFAKGEEPSTEPTFEFEVIGYSEIFDALLEK